MTTEQKYNIDSVEAMLWGRNLKCNKDGLTYIFMPDLDANNLIITEPKYASSRLSNYKMYVRSDKIRVEIDGNDYEIIPVGSNKFEVTTLCVQDNFGEKILFEELVSK